MMSEHVKLNVDEDLNAIKEPTSPIASPNEEFAKLINLSSLLLDNLKTPSYNLLPEQIEWIKKFIETSPEVFDIILKDITAITADGKIDSHDIPLLIKLITDVYNSGAITNNMTNSKNIIAFVKFTLEVILDSNSIDITLIKGIIDSSISLLSMNVGSNDKRQSVLSVICTIISKFVGCFSAK